MKTAKEFTTKLVEQRTEIENQIRLKAEYWIEKILESWYKDLINNRLTINIPTTISTKHVLQILEEQGFAYNGEDNNYDITFPEE